MRDYLDQMRSLYADRLPAGWWEHERQRYREDRPVAYAPGPDDGMPDGKNDKKEDEKGRRVIIIDYNSEDQEDDNRKDTCIELNINDIPEEADSE